jgi:hypothetical protein
MAESVAGPSGLGCAASKCWCGDCRCEDVGGLQAFLPFLPAQKHTEMPPLKTPDVEARVGGC